MGSTRHTAGDIGTRTHRRRRVASLAIASAVVLGACSAGGDDDSAAAEEPAADEPAFDDAADAASGDPDTEPEAAATGGDSPSIDLGAIGRDVIIEMTVSMTSDDIEGTVTAITSAASRLGGGVASSDIDYGDPAQPEQRSGRAWIVVKVPPESIDRLLSGLAEAGTVRAINQSAQDVTDQLVDLDVRIRNARESVANVREFMDRTESLDDLVALESELTRRQTDLERLEAQQRNLDERVALSTVTIEVVPPAEIPEPEPVDDDDGLADALRSGWDAFARAVYGVAYVLLALMPFLVTGGIALLAAWWVARRRRPDAAGAAVADRPAAQPAPPADQSAGQREDEPQPVG